MVIKEFMDEAGVTEWIVDLCYLLLKARDEELLDDSTVKIEALRKLVTTKHYHHKRKY